VIGGFEPGAVRPSVPVSLTVLENRRENSEAATLLLARPEDEEEAARRGLDLSAFVPGQFVMVWLPRLDEKPFALSHLDAQRVGITVRRRGPFSTRLMALRPGDRVGLRGPFGKGFRGAERYADSERVALVGGGCGLAVLRPLARRLARATVVQGARSADELLFTDEFPRHVVFTDDGSAGRKGFPTRWVEEHGGELEMVYTCGPEAMMYEVVSICRRLGLLCQASLERYMKCGIGLCGQCDCDGQRVCVEGPVFDLDELAQMPSFGRTRRDATGRRIPVEGCPAGPGADLA